MSEPSYGEFNPIELDNELFQLQAVEFEDETVFMLKRNNEIICAVMLDENNEWKPDCEMTGSQFAQLMNWIKKLYLKEQ